MTDRRTRILARCAELRRIAEAAAAREGGATWHACYRPNEAAWAWDVAVDPKRPGYGIVDGRTEETATHVATWDPAAVLALVAGAEKMCEIHKADADVPDGECEGCGQAEGSWFRYKIADCPSLEATEAMLP